MASATTLRCMKAAVRRPSVSLEADTMCTATGLSSCCRPATSGACRRT